MLGKEEARRKKRKREGRKKREREEVGLLIRETS